MPQLSALTDTWNAAGTTFDAIKMSVTDTASQAASRLLNIQVGGVSKVSATKLGVLSLTTLSADTVGAGVEGYKARGTTSPAVLTTGDILLPITGYGYDGASYLSGAQIRFESTGTIASTRMPGKMVFATATDATPSVLTDRMFLLTTGQLSVGDPAPNANNKFTVYDSVTANGKQIGISDGSLRYDIGYYNSYLRFANSAGTTHAVINWSTGLFGIGTTAPDKALEINSATGACLRLTYNDSNGSAANYADFSVSSSGDLTIAPSGGDLVVTGNLSPSGYTTGSVQSLSGAGAVNVTQAITEVTTTGVGDALTLADGVAGQTKTIIHGVDGGSFVLTPTTKTGWSTFTSTVAGESITLVFLATRGWIVKGSYLGVIAP